MAEVVRKDSSGKRDLDLCLRKEEHCENWYSNVFTGESQVKNYIVTVTEIQIYPWAPVIRTNVTYIC